MAIILNIFFISIFVAGNSITAQFISNEVFNQISFRIYTGNTMDDGYHDALAENAGDLGQWYNDSMPTMIYVHGWSEGLNSSSTNVIVSSFITNGKFNIIAVDWSPVSSKNYIVATLNVKGVASTIARGLNLMFKKFLDSTRLWIIGHSLGAQITGHLQKETKHSIPRITGLDPAGPGFYFLENHLESGDAEFVDIIHTDGGFYGNALMSGDVNILPNEGTRTQPGCPAPVRPTSDDDFCSHHRSYIFFGESVANGDDFIAVNCRSQRHFRKGRCSMDNTVVIGVSTNRHARGTFYLSTNAQSPYSRGEDGLRPVS